VRIGELARSAGATAKTVRFYEQADARAVTTGPAECSGDRVCSILDIADGKAVVPGGESKRGHNRREVAVTAGVGYDA
jgi:hypothetical protein